LKDRKKKTLMCLLDLDLSDSELESITDNIFNSQDNLSQIAGFPVKTINLYHLTEKKFTRKFKSKTLKVNHRTVNNLEKIISNPFYKIDMKYKKPKDDEFYQRRLMSRQPFEKYMIKFTPMTLLLVTLNTIVLLINLIFIHLFNTYELTNLLAVSHYEVSSGEYYRLVTSTFLHVGVSHFLFNIFALYILGKFVEGIYTPWHMLITYLAAGSIASLFSLVFITEGISLGASGGVYGLLGLIIIHLLITRKIKAKLIVQIIAVFVVVSVLSMFFANINHYAHIGGLIVGVLLGIIFNFKRINIKYSIIAAAVLILFTMFSHFGMNQQTSIHPMDDEALHYYEEGNYDAALEVVNSSINKNVATDMTYYILGKLYIESGDEEKGQQYVDKSYEMDQSNELAAKEKILEFRKVQDYENMNEAISKLETPVEDKELKILIDEAK
ncbi:MAG: rhomboid family intramembrane serine protease, partial [Jeotgalicoccus sp.]